jgi:hypothetical protein
MWCPTTSATSALASLPNACQALFDTPIASPGSSAGALARTAVNHDHLARLRELAGDDGRPSQWRLLMLLAELGTTTDEGRRSTAATTTPRAGRVALRAVSAARPARRRRKDVWTRSSRSNESPMEDSARFSTSFCWRPGQA